MNLTEIEEKVQSIVDNFSEEEFIYELLEAYGKPKSSITRLRKGTYNLSKNPDEIIWKKNLLYKVVPHEDLHLTIDQLNNNDEAMRHNPRFLIVTDYETFLAVDTKTNDTLDIQFNELHKRFDFFLPWAGLEKAQDKLENPADIKAAEKLARLYDIICEENPDMVGDRSSLHELNVFLARLLFCYFAEDTEIFEKDLFSNSIESHTLQDGSDLNIYLDKLFEVLNTEQPKPDLQNLGTILEPLNKNKRDSLPDYLNKFPYVNGGLFKDKIQIPIFTSRSRKMLIECGSELDWSNINPDIFGSMMQAVVHQDERSGLGMHYTSVTNIMKVIEPLFLNNLYYDFGKSEDSTNKLERLLSRLYNLKIFDPACGSGNFLIIAYKELRKLEMEILQRIKQISPDTEIPMLSNILVSQFYGIELDDFAHEIAILSLWLAQHQMNKEFKKVFGRANPSLPLKESGNIICGNATRLDWNKVCPKDNYGEIFVLGNPPYLGFKKQNKNQKSDMSHIFDGQESYKQLDYISCWFYKASLYLDSNVKVAFVSTNSICQGTQVEMLWPKILNTDIEIYFAVRTFKWSNYAKQNAGVSCVIIGFGKKCNIDKYIIDNNHYIKAKNINAYLLDADNLIIKKRRNVLSKLPNISDGNGALDGGFLVLSNEEKLALEEKYPGAIEFIRPYLGSNEYINGITRWCLWIQDGDQNTVERIEPINKRINKVREFRKNAGTRAKTALNRPHKFAWINTPKKSQIIIPTVSSERRKYIPIGFLNANIIISNSANIVHDPEPYIFGLLTSKMHMVWVKAVAGRLEERVRYTSAICYNTFPAPDITNKQKESISTHSFNVLAEREKYSERTMAELYDPDKMPTCLRKAHNDLDLAVERCYRSKPFENDVERLEHLFNLYEEMTKRETLIA